MEARPKLTTAVHLSLRHFGDRDDQILRRLSPCMTTTPREPLPSTWGRQVPHTTRVRLRGFTKYPSDVPSSTTWTAEFLYRRPEHWYDYHRRGSDKISVQLHPLRPLRECLLPLRTCSAPKMHASKAASSPAATRNTEVAELQRKLDIAEDDIALINRRLDDSQDGAAAVEALRAELARAKEQARCSNATAEKASADLRAEQTARRQNEEKVSALALELKNTANCCEYLEKENKAKKAELDKALREASEARSESRAAREEIRQTKEIAAGKPFLLQTKFGDPDYAQLNQVWSSPVEFLDLPKSSSDAAQFYQAQEGYATEKLFWSQFGASKRTVLLNE
nr:uncharacterized protein LOC120973272 [Aegilops tauschii subsp. strangulata]